MKTAEEIYPYLENEESSIGIREHNQRMYDCRQAYNKGFAAAQFAAPPPASEGELTEGQFCKLHSAMHGEEIDHVDQLVFSRMTGRELYEFVKFCVATLPTMEPEGEGKKL